MARDLTAQVKLEDQIQVAFKDALKKLRTLQLERGYGPQWAATMQQLAQNEERAKAIHLGQRRERCVLQLIGWNHIVDPNSRRCWVCKHDARQVLHGQALKARLKRMKSEATTPLVSRFIPDLIQWRCEDHAEDKEEHVEPLQQRRMDRMAIELQDSLGKVRATSIEDLATQLKGRGIHTDIQVDPNDPSMVHVTAKWPGKIGPF